MIQKVWAHFFDIWNLRCDKRHRLDLHRVSQQHTHRVHTRTQAIYAVIEQLPPTETQASPYFDKELVTQIDQPTRNIEVWLAQHMEPLVQQGLAEAAQTVAWATLTFESILCLWISCSTPISPDVCGLLRVTLHQPPKHRPPQTT
jgi:hypothetical protein